MTKLWWFTPAASFERLAVVRESPGRIYFASPRDGSTRFVSRAALERLGWLYSSPIRASVYSGAGRAAFLAAVATTDPSLAALGLQRDATADDVRRAFRARAKTAHPDTGGSAEAFIALRRNYERALAVVGQGSGLLGV